MYNNKRRIAKINQILNAWATQAPDAKFANRTLTQFTALIKPVLDAYAKLQETEASITGQRQDLANMSKDLMDQVFLVVDSAKGDPAFGPNSPLYVAMGYIAKNKRKSGRTWKTEAPAAPVASEKQS